MLNKIPLRKQYTSLWMNGTKVRKGDLITHMYTCTLYTHTLCNIYTCIWEWDKVLVSWEMECPSRSDMGNGETVSGWHLSTNHLICYPLQFTNLIINYHHSLSTNISTIKIIHTHTCTHTTYKIKHQKAKGKSCLLLIKHISTFKQIKIYTHMFHTLKRFSPQFIHSVINVYIRMCFVSHFYILIYTTHLKSLKDSSCAYLFTH